MLTYKKDDFDESLEDIMASVDKIINANKEEDTEENENEEKN